MRRVAGRKHAASNSAVASSPLPLVVTFVEMFLGKIDIESDRLVPNTKPYANLQYLVCLVKHTSISAVLVKELACSLLLLLSCCSKFFQFYTDFTMIL